jgi:hypothetical protein
MPAKARPFGKAVLHRGDDLIWQTQFEDRSTRDEDRSKSDNESGGLRLASDLGFECIELMLEVRERFLQISQFFRGDLDAYDPPRTMRPRLEGVCRMVVPQRIRTG